VILCYEIAKQGKNFTNLDWLLFFSPDKGYTSLIGAHMQKIFHYLSFSVATLVLCSSASYARSNSYYNSPHAAVYVNETEQEIASTSEAKFKISTGFDYSKGDYGQAQDTEILYVPVSGKVEYDQWTVKITVPHVTIKGPGSVVGDEFLGTGGGAVTTESGLGDIIAAATYTVDLPYESYLDLTTKVKLPTADENKGLGTGEIDYTLQADYTKMFNKISVFSTLGYKFVGSNSLLNLHDVWILGVGTNFQYSKKLGTGLMYDWREAASATGKDPSEATAYVNYKITKTVNAQMYLVKGFSDGSADQGGGLLLGYKF
jgi:hypothetical protein